MLVTSQLTRYSFSTRLQKISSFQRAQEVRRGQRRIRLTKFCSRFFPHLRRHLRRPNHHLRRHLNSTHSKWHSQYKINKKRKWGHLSTNPGSRRSSQQRILRLYCHLQGKHLSKTYSDSARHKINARDLVALKFKWRAASTISNYIQLSLTYQTRFRRTTRPMRAYLFLREVEARAASRTIPYVTQ